MLITIFLWKNLSLSFLCKLNKTQCIINTWKLFKLDKLFPLSINVVENVLPLPKVEIHVYNQNEINYLID